MQVIDKHSDIAGNIYTEEIERNNVHVYGAHILHINEDMGFSRRELYNMIQKERNLVILAVGIGSRFKGGIKQLQGVGPQIVNQVQHFLLKFQLEFSNQDTFWDGY